MPRIYFAFGHLGLLWALFVAATDPSSISGFFFHPPMFAVVHLLTLGWITHSIIGATYLSAPLALRTGKGDAWVCAFIAIGASGVVAHFIIEEYSGVAYSGGMLLLGFGHVAGKVWRALPSADLPGATKWAVGLAYGNLLLTAVLGTLLAINKHHPFFPGDHLTSVFGHASLGLMGWGLMVFVAVMAPARGAVFVIQGGLLAVSACYLLAPSLVRWASALPAIGIGWFVARASWRSRALPALAYLVATAVTGLLLVFPSRFDHGLVMAYGTFALVGFLSQAALLAQLRLFQPRLGRACQVVWNLGVPALAYGFSQPDDTFVSLGAWLLIAGTIPVTVAALRRATTSNPS